MSLKVALLCSLWVHAGLLAIRPPAEWVPPRSSLEVLEVTYLPVGLTADPLALPKHKAAPKVPKQAVAAPVLVEKKTVPAPTPSFDPPKPSRKPLHPTVQSAPNRSSRPDQTLAQTPGAASFAEGEFAEITHKEQVREHLKEHLKYPVFWVQGSVQLRVDLYPKGGLREALVLESSDARLAQEAIRGAKSAAPYPTFPSALRKQQIRYDFLVQYRRD